MKIKSKRPTIKQARKRPKSVLAKAWETRRKNAAAKTAETLTPLKDARTMQGATGDNRALPNRPSEVTAAIHRTLEIAREEQLLAFLGDMWAIRETKRHNDHFPILVSRTQVEAIESFLGDHGYSAWGKGSGRLASVSTSPNADDRKAA